MNSALENLHFGIDIRDKAQCSIFYNIKRQFTKIESY